eukprot:gene27724-30713_t
MCHAQVANLPPGPYQLIIPLAPNTPFPPLENFNITLSGQGTGADFTVPATRYPIIPMLLLTNFYRAVVSNHGLPQLRSFFPTFANMIRNYASNGAVNCSNDMTANAIVEASNLALAQQLGWARHATTAAVPPGLGSLGAYYAWLPGNFYIGPSNLNDTNTGAPIDMGSVHVVGQAYWNKLSETAALMQSYINNPNLAVLPIIDRNLTTIAQTQNAFPLVPISWQFSGGEYRINTNRPIPSDDPSDTSEPVVGLATDACTALVPTFDQIRRRYSALTIDD